MRYLQYSTVHQCLIQYNRGRIIAGGGHTVIVVYISANLVVTSVLIACRCGYFLSLSVMQAGWICIAGEAHYGCLRKYHCISKQRQKSRRMVLRIEDWGIIEWGKNCVWKKEEIIQTPACLNMKTSAHYFRICNGLGCSWFCNTAIKNKKMYYRYCLRVTLILQRLEYSTVWQSP